jgi:hypothetical protein
MQVDGDFKISEIDPSHWYIFVHDQKDDQTLDTRTSIIAKLENINKTSFQFCKM